MPTKNPHAVALGRRGGRVKSERKAIAVRENGKKGGRPPATPHTCNPEDRREGQVDADCARCTQIVERRRG